MGVAFLITSMFIYIYLHNFVKNGEKTTAMIVEITTSGSGEDKKHLVEVEYHINDVEYSNFIGYYHSDMREGQIVPIIYLPNIPDKIIYGENVYILFWMFFGVGTSFSIVGSVLLIIHKKRL